MHSIARKIRLDWAIALLVCWTGCGSDELSSNDPSSDPSSLKTQLEDVQSQIEKLEDSGEAELAQELRRSLKKALADVKTRAAPAATYKTLQQVEFEHSAAEVRQLLQDLPGGPDGVLAVEYSNHLTRLESGMQEGSIHMLPDASPIVHWIHCHNELRDASRTVEIDLDIEARPNILVLSSLQHTTWILNQSPASQVEAVLLLSETDELQTRKPVLRFHRVRPIRNLDHTTREIVSNYIAHQVGKRPTSILQVDPTESVVRLAATREDWVRAYVFGEIQALKEEVRKLINNQFARRHREIRFSALTTTKQDRGRSRAEAEFTLRGPNLPSQRPVGGSYWNLTKTADDTVYSLHRHGLHRKSESSKWIPISRPSTIRDNTRFLALTYDGKRDRLLLLDHDHMIHKMDCVSGDWKTVALVDDAVAMKWTPSDELVVITQSPENVQETRFRTELCFLNSDCEPIRKITTTCSTRMLGRYESSSNELSLRDDFLLAVQPASGVQHHSPNRTVIRAIDLRNGKLRYEYQVRPINTDTVQPVRSWLRHGDDTRLVVFRERLRAARVSVLRIGVDHSDQSVHFEKRIADLQNPIQFFASQTSQPSVQWIRTYSRTPPLVRISDKSRPLTLAISSFNAHEWRVEIENGVELQKVILTCDAIVPAIRGLPSNIDVVVHSRNDVPKSDLAINRQPFYLRSVIQKLARSEIACEMDLDLLKNNEFTIGPENGDWVVQQSLEELDQVILSSNHLSQAGNLPEDFRFFYRYFGEGPSTMATEGRYATHHFVECDYRGPILNTFWGPDPIRDIPEDQLMHDARSARVFRIEDDELHIGDADGWSSRKLPMISAEAWCFDSRQQRFQAIVRKGRQLVEVCEVSDAGAILRQRTLPVPIPCGYSPSRRTCSIFGDTRHLIIVLQSPPHIKSKHNNVYVLDLADLSIVYQGPFKPHLVYEPVDEQLFQSLWATLADAEPRRSQQAIMRLAAGLADSSDKIEQKLGLQTMSAEEAWSYIRQLDADKFVARDAAYQALANSLLILRPQLEKALADAELSREQELRLRSLLSRVTSRLEVRALAVLKLIEDHRGR